MKYLSIPGTLGRNGRNDILRLVIDSKSAKKNFKELMKQIDFLSLDFNCNAVQYTKKKCVIKSRLLHLG
jgi:hypothetical protein